MIALISGVPYLTKHSSRTGASLTFWLLSLVAPVLFCHLLKDQKQGHDEHVIDLLVPLGYTFNLEGAAVYSSSYYLCAHAYGIAFSHLVSYFTIARNAVGKTLQRCLLEHCCLAGCGAAQLRIASGEGVALIFCC